MHPAYPSTLERHTCSREQRPGLIGRQQGDERREDDLPPVAQRRIVGIWPRAEVYFRRKAEHEGGWAYGTCAVGQARLVLSDKLASPCKPAVADDNNEAFMPAKSRKSDEQRLEVVIQNTKPVALTDLTLALLAIGQQYEQFVEHELPPEAQISSTLLVKEVRTGSIIFELIAQAVPIAPLLWQGGSMLEWAKCAKDILLFLQSKLKNPPKDLTKQDLKQWDSILEPVAKDSGSQMNFVVHEGGTVQQFIVNSTAANVAQNQIRKQLAQMEEPVDVTHKKRVMTWYQAKFDPDSQTGSKVRIESISKKPLRVLFDNNAIKDAMYAQGSEFDVPWQKLAYVVDVQIQTINEQPKVALITKFYPKQTFNPDD
jgi:hypothetical protein